VSSGRQVLGIVGTIAGSAFGPVGAFIGGTIGGEVGGFIDGPPEGPRLDDLSAPQVQFGGKIGRGFGGPEWWEVSPLYFSEKRESSEVVGGKGGDSGQEQFSYSVDVLFRVCESREGTPCEVIAVTGVEIDGQLVWTALADATNASVFNSQAQEEDWSTMEVLLGSETQAPWSVLEAAEGVGNANAYRGYLTVGFTDFLLGPGGQPRRVRIQTITAGTSETIRQGDGLLCHFDANASAGVIASALGPDGTTISGAALSTGTDDGYFGLSGDHRGLTTLGQEFRFSGITGTHGEAWRVQLFIRNSSVSCDAIEIIDNATGDRITLSVPAGTFNDILFNFAAEFSAGGGGLGDGTNKANNGVYNHIVIQGVTSSLNAEVLINGAFVGNVLSSGNFTPGFFWDFIRVGKQLASGTAEVDEIYYEVDLLASELYPHSYVVPTSPFTASGQQGTVWTPLPVPLQDILEYEAERCGVAAANIDFSAAAGLEVELHSGVGSAVEMMQPLLTRFWFDFYSSDKLYIVRRGGTVEQTIPFRWTGSGAGQRSDPFSGLIRSNDVEVAKKRAVTYQDILKDGEADTRTGDRESVGTDIETLRLNLHMRPTEAQGLADTATWDARIGAHRATVRFGARHGLLMQPGSVVNLVDHKGNTYRVMVLRIVWDRWVWECDVRLDDPSILQEVGIAVDLDQRALTVAEPPEATLYVLDIPLLRPQDDGPGIYVAITQTGRFRGVDILKSSDNVTFANVAEITTRGTAGVCDSALGSYTGWGWDNRSFTATMDEGSGVMPSSATKAAVEASRSLNLASVGALGEEEIIQFATATLVTGRTYLFSGILRNLYGSERNNASHAIGDKFVILQANGMARVPGVVSDLNQTRHFKAVPRGRSSANVTAESITCREIGLTPYAPVDVRNDAGTLRCNRRSRLEGAIGLAPPLGEVSERYDAETYNGMSLDDSESGLTVPEWVPSTASGRTARFYQLSDLVGRGHVAEKEIP
jgi:Putative phage tail protein